LTVIGTCLLAIGIAPVYYRHVDNEIEWAPAFVVWDPPQCELGGVTFGERRKASLKVGNLSSGPVYLRTVRTSCACVHAELTPRVLGPHESAEVPIFLTAPLVAASGLDTAPIKLEHHLLVGYHTNEGDDAVAVLPVTAELGPLVYTQPRQITLPSLKGSTPRFSEVALNRGVMSAGDFQAVRISGPSYYEIQLKSSDADQSVWDIGVKENAAPLFLRPAVVEYTNGDDYSLLRIPVRYAKARCRVEPDGYFFSWDTTTVKEYSRIQESRRRFEVQASDSVSIAIQELRNEDRNSVTWLGYAIVASSLEGGPDSFDVWVKEAPGGPRERAILTVVVETVASNGTIERVQLPFVVRVAVR
jgi:hypothetical protein